MSALGLAAGAALPVRAQLPALDELSRTGGDLADLFHNRESARAVGLEYLRAVPEEADPERLVSLIGESGSEQPPRDGAPGSLRPWLERRQREDFARSRTVEVRGWLLSRTEARLCAYAVFA